MMYVKKHGVSRAGRKYNKPRSYIYRWKQRWDGTPESLVCFSRRPHSHPNAHTPEEIAMIKRYRKRNPNLSVTELWARLKKHEYTRRPESLYREMKKLGLIPAAKKQKKYVPKPYEQMGVCGRYSDISNK